MLAVKKRDFLKCLTAVCAAPFAVTAAAFRRMRTPREVWGPMDVSRHRSLIQRGIHLHIYSGGVDVSNRCRFFDDTPSHQRAELFLHNADGRPYLNARRDAAAYEVITEFEIRRGKPFKTYQAFPTTR